MMKEREEKDKSKLTIRLAEPVIYLKDVDFSGRCRTHNELSPPSMVRGILVLHLSKPTKISSVEIELTAKSSTRYPEGLGSRRIEVTEEHQLYSSSTIYFRQEAEGHHSRRAESLGPTSSRTTVGEDDTSSDFDVDHEGDDIPHTRRTYGVVGGRRGTSVDLPNYHRDVISHHATTDIPSPAYVPTPEGSPASSAANLPGIRLTPPPDQGSPPQLCSLSHALPNLPLDKRDQRVTRPGTCDDLVPFPSESRTRAVQALEDFRRALRPDSDTASVLSAPPTSAHASLILSPSLHTPLSKTPSRFSSSRSPDRFDGDAQGRRRSKSRFSLSAISDAILDSVRSRSPMPTKRRAEGSSVGADPHDSEKNGGPTRGRSREKGKGRNRDLSNALVKVGEVLGLEPEEGKEPRDGWKEFKKGTYAYPISFAIPADSPPSSDCAYGSIVWSMKATVHRPGVFTPRMETIHTINVVAAPSEDATDDVESVTVNKPWEDQMVYNLSIVGRAFPIGSRIPIQLTFLPLAKIKIHKVSVVIDEKVTYYSQTQRAARTPSATRQVLCCVQYPGRSRTPILPLVEEDPRNSPLYALVHDDLEYTGQSEEERVSKLTSEWMGPGPWPLRLNVKISSFCGTLRPTNMNKKGNITVSHMLKIIIRVEKEDTGDADSTKRKKLFDIVIQYPINLLSYLCNKKYTSLPPYSSTWHSVPTAPAQSSSSRLGPSDSTQELSSGPPTPEYTVLTDSALMATSRERERLTQQLERLISGQETETGEFPPSYSAATSQVHVNHLG